MTASACPSTPHPFENPTEDVIKGALMALPEPYFDGAEWYAAMKAGFMQSMGNVQQFRFRERDLAFGLAYGKSRMVESMALRAGFKLKHSWPEMESEPLPDRLKAARMERINRAQKRRRGGR